MKKRRKIVVERHLTTERPKPIIIACANCSQSCTTLVDRNKRVKMENGPSNCVHEISIDLNQQDSHKGAEKINVKTALSLIYKLKVVHELNLDGSADEEIVLCERCGELLQTLYILYDEFDHLRQQDSYLQKKVSQLDELLAQLQETWTEMANMEKSQNNDEQSDDEPVVQKKSSAKSTPVKTPNDEPDAEVMIVEEKKKVVRSEFVDLTLPSTVDNVVSNRKNNSQQQQQQPQPQRFKSAQPSTSSSSHCRVQPKDLERQILEEIHAITAPPAAAGAGGISHNNEIIFNDDDPADINFHSEADFDYEDETMDDDAAFEAIAKAVRHSENNINMASAAADRGSNYWDESDGVLQEDTDFQSNSRSDRDNRLSRCSYCFKTFMYTNDLAAHVASCLYNRANIFDTDGTNDVEIDDEDQEIESPPRGRRGSEDSEWGTSLKSRQYRRTPRVGRKPVIKIYENCPLCPNEQVVFCDAVERSEHFMGHHEDQKLKKTPKCRICQKTVTTYFSLRTHVRGHAADFRYVCERVTCARSFLTSQQLELHCCNSGQPPPPKAAAQKSAASSSGSHSGRRNLGKRRNKFIKKRNDMSIHTSCPICNDGVIFDKPRSLSNHWWSDHRSSGDERKCRICHRLLSSRASLRIHYKAHAADHAYVCPKSECSRAFLTLQQMEKHCVTYGHSGDGEGHDVEATSSDHDPEQGQKSSDTASRRSRHWPRARVVEVYKSCPLCPEGLSSTFAYPSDFTHHLWNIHRPTNDECPMCNKKFSSSVYLKTHFQAHAGDRKYHCVYPQCGLAFMARHQLRTHERHFHPKEGEDEAGNEQLEDGDSMEMVQVGGEDDDDDNSKSPSDVELDNVKLEN